jgi:hypothetical protein
MEKKIKDEAKAAKEAAKEAEKQKKELLRLKVLFLLLPTILTLYNHAGRKSAKEAFRIF